MDKFDSFLSVVAGVRNEADTIDETLPELCQQLEQRFKDYEIVIVDNASTDDTIKRIERQIATLPNVHLYCLARRVENDTALLAGIENSIGDFVATIELGIDPPAAISALMSMANEGYDIVEPSFGIRSSSSALYNGFSSLFFGIYQRFTGLDLRTESPIFRLLSRRVVFYLLQHDKAHIMLRALPVMSGYPRVKVSLPTITPRKLRDRPPIGTSINRAVSVMLATTAGPIRLVTAFACASALLNLIYAVYVLTVAMVREHVAEGWVTLSLQNAGMFFLICLILAMFSEYIVRLLHTTQARPRYHVSRELVSPVVAHTAKLNILQEARQPRKLQDILAQSSGS